MASLTINATPTNTLATPNASNLGTPNLNPNVDTKDRDITINTIHQGGPPSEQKVAAALATAAEYSNALAKQIATRVDILAEPSTSITTTTTPSSKSKSSKSSTATKKLSPHSQRAATAAADRKQHDNSIADANYAVAQRQRRNRRPRGLKKVQNSSSQSHFRPAKPLTVTHGDAWENASGTGRKKIEHVNKQQSNVDSKNADLTWKAGKKQSKDNTQTKTTGIKKALSHGIRSERPTSPVLDHGLKTKKSFKIKNESTFNRALDQFETSGISGKKQMADTKIFTSSMKGAAAIQNKADSWIANGKRLGKKQSLYGTGFSSMHGGGTDILAAKVQKIRIHLVKNSQRNGSNLGSGLIVKETDGIHTKEQIRERSREERPQKKHTHNDQNDHLRGARLSIHSNDVKRGLKRVEGVPTNHSSFSAQGCADVVPSAVSERRQLKKVPSARGEEFHFTGTSMSPKKGSQRKQERQLKTVEGKSMYTRTKQVTAVRGLKLTGPMKRAATCVNVGRLPAGVSSKRATGLARTRGVGLQTAPPRRTPGGNSQIVFG